MLMHLSRFFIMEYILLKNSRRSSRGCGNVEKAFFPQDHGYPQPCTKLFIIKNSYPHLHMDNRSNDILNNRYTGFQEDNHRKDRITSDAFDSLSQILYGRFKFIVFFQFFRDLFAGMDNGRMVTAEAAADLRM